MRKPNIWHLLPLLSLSILLVNTTVAFGAEDGQEQVMTLQETPADQLAEMKAVISRKAIAKQVQRVNPYEGRPRQTRNNRSILRDVELDLNLLDLPAVDEGRFDRRFLSKAMVTTPLTVTVNGASSTTLNPGDSLEIVITFSDSLTYAAAEFWVDVDADGLLDDAIDFDLDEGGLAIDNGEEDLDLRDSVFKIILWPDDEEGFLSVTNLQLLLVVADDLAADTATVSIGESATTDYASGTVTPAAANVIIVAFPTSLFFDGGPDGPHDGGPDGPHDGGSDGGPDGGPKIPPYLTVTNASGLYNIYLDAPDSLEIFAVDFLNAQPGLVPDTMYHNEMITGATTGLDFNYITPTAFIAGFVEDAAGFAVPGVTVFAEQDGPGVESEAITDATGAYSIGVLPGFYRVEVSDDVIPDYMVSQNQWVEVMDGGTANANFTIYPTTAEAAISGTVTLNGMPLGGIEIEAWGMPEGTMDDPNAGMRTFTESDPVTGEYVLNVSPLVNNDGYFIMPHDWPDGTYMNNKLDHIPAGASMVNIDFVAATGGLYGVITVLGSSPVDTLYDVGIFIYDTTTGFETWTGPDWETGVYSVPLPPGNYFIEVGSWDFKHYMAGPIPVADAFVPWDVELEAIVFNSEVFGRVTDAEGMFGLAGADVWIGSKMEEYGDHTNTDADGYYHFAVPAGDYNIGTEAPGYFGDYREVTAPADGSVEVNFALNVFSFTSPFIHAIMDKPTDQGGWALIHFAGGSSDFGPFFGWSIWAVSGPDYFPDEMINVGFFLGDPREGRTDYTVLVPTFVDSNTTTGTDGTNSFESWYVITGFADAPEGGMIIENSPPDRGWSIDNILPGVPAGLALSPNASGFTLAWDASGDADYQYNVVNVAYKSGGEANLAVSGTSIELTSANITLGSEFDVSVAAVDANGNYSVFSVALNSETLDLDDGLTLPGKYALMANYPNPFNPSTTLQFALPQYDKVSLIVYDLTGREIRSLVSSDLPAGLHRVVWNGRDGRERGVATGVYFYRIITGSGFTATRKMVFMK